MTNQAKKFEFERRAIVEWLESKAEFLKPGHQYVALTTAMLAVNKMRESVLNAERGTCEFLTQGARAPFPQCGRKAVMAYPAAGGSWMYLCEEHGRGHKEYCRLLESATTVDARPTDLELGKADGSATNTDA